jgi:hypothetical protein
MPVILATQEAEIRKIAVRSQPRQIIRETLSRKTLHKSRTGGVAQGEGLEFKPQYRKKQTKNLPLSNASCKDTDMCKNYYTVLSIHIHTYTRCFGNIKKRKFFFFCSTRVGTQGLHLEPFHQSSPFL